MRAAVAAALFTGLVAGALARGPEGYSKDALRDEVHGLPGAPDVAWRMFSGYIDVSAPGEAANTRQMFYWFAESQHAPTTDPVVLWTNGGPGCSGLSGFLSEQGPFRAVPNGTLKLNDYTWTKVANMVFIEQPVGVGFSMAAGKIDYGDAQAAADNHRFVVGFFKRFKQYASQDFYISSESYGGHYMPTLARELKQAGDVPQFRGVFLGNPLTYMMYRNYGEYGTAWGHQLLSAPLWARYEAASCATNFPPSDACNKITGEMDDIIGGFDPYALDFAVCNSPQSAAGRHERWTFRRAILRAKASLKGSSHEALLTASSNDYEPCIDNFVTSYLNRAEVKTALHVKSEASWSVCSNTVGGGYNASDLNVPMMPVWKELIAKGDIKIMIYSGDDDSVCATLGSQQFVWDLGYPPKTSKVLGAGSWLPWKVDGQTAGFRTDFEVPTGAFTFVTVHGAGHMVPSTQPARSLALLKSFLGAKSVDLIV